MSGVSLPQAIGLIGGVPILRNILGHTCDHLRIPRHIDIGTAGTAGTQQNLLSGVLTGGVGSLLQSPLGSSLAPLTSAISTAVSSLTSVGSSGSGSGADGPGSDSGSGSSDPGASGFSDSGEANSYQPLITALGNLSMAATNLSSLADNLVGVTSNTALPTQMDAIAHMGAMQSLGPSVPSALSLATVVAPVQSAPVLTAALSSVTTITSQVVAGTLDVSEAVTAVQTIQAGMDAVTNASTNAISTVQNAQPSLCAAQSAIALLVGGSSDMIAAMMVAIQPSQLATIQGIVAAHNEALALTP